MRQEVCLIISHMTTKKTETAIKSYWLVLIDLN